MRRRVNVTLPEETIRLIDRVSRKGDRSRLIDAAVKHFVRTQRRERLKDLLKVGAQARAERDLALAEEWFPIDEAVWQGSKR